MSLILSESLVLAKTRSQDLKSVLKLNCWGSSIKDVSLVRQLINVEVIGLSCNEITTLEDFAYCPKLRELILRKNKIKNIAEIAHLQQLPKLTSLWLGENPCAETTHNYRKVVLKALPNLTVLDNTPVTKEELQEIEELGNEIYEEIPYESSSSSGSCPTTTTSTTTITNAGRPLPAQPMESNEVTTEVQHDTTNNDVQYNMNEISYYQPNDSNDVSASHDNNNSINQNRAFQMVSRGSRCLSSQGSYSSNNINSNYNNNNFLPKVGGKSRSGNILSAVLCLVKELDYTGCEVVQTALHCRMEETHSN